MVGNRGEAVTSRVLMTHDYPPCTGGGLALAARELARLLDADGVGRPEILSSRLHDHFTDDRGCLDADLVRTLVGALRRIRQCDVLVAHWTFSFRWLATLSLLVGPLLHKRTVCVIHTSPAHVEHNRIRRLPVALRRLLLRTAARLMRRCHAVVALGESHQDACARWGIEVTHVLPFWVPAPGARADTGRAADSAGWPTVGIAGELSHLKGTDRLVPILQEVSSRLRFHIAGTGPLAEGLARSVGRLPPSQRRNVVLLGRLPPHRMPDFFQDVDLLLVLSRTEAQPRIVLEAMAHGVVVVAGRDSGVDDLIRDGVTGILVDASDPGRCAEQLVALTRDRSLRERIGRQAVCFADRHRAACRRGWQEFLGGLAR
jgi:1,2-diacylglycerol 3-alpha-glucosyltransferase